MAEEIQNQDQIEQLGDSLTKVEQFVEQNKKVVLCVVAVIVLLICGFFAYKNLYLNKQQDKALAAMWQAEAQFRADSFHIALYGNENVTGFIDVVDEFGSTKAGNTARYYAGCCAMRLGEYETAIEYLEDFSCDDPIVEPLAFGLLGDAYNETGDFAKSVKYYKKAAKVAGHELLSPRYLMKAGMTLEKMEKYSEAVEVYQSLKKEYSGSPEASSVDKYITRAQLKK